MKPSEKTIRDLKARYPEEVTLFYKVVTEEFEKEFLFEPNTPQKVIDETYKVFWKGAKMFKDKLRRDPRRTPSAFA